MDAEEFLEPTCLPIWQQDREIRLHKVPCAACVVAGRPKLEVLTVNGAIREPERIFSVAVLQRESVMRNKSLPASYWRWEKTAVQRPYGLQRREHLCYLTGTRRKILEGQGYS